MEGSLRAVDRTVSAAAEILVGFNVFPRYRDSVSESSQLPQWGRRQKTDSRTGRVQRISLKLGGTTDFNSP